MNFINKRLHFLINAFIRAILERVRQRRREKRGKVRVREIE